MKRKVKERRLVYQDWYETELTKTGWDSNTGWYFREGDFMTLDWTIVEILDCDKHYNPLLGIAERKIKVRG